MTLKRTGHQSYLLTLPRMGLPSQFLYVTPTTDTKKDQCIPHYQTKQLLEMGQYNQGKKVLFDPQPSRRRKHLSSRARATEENLRLLIFNRQGLHEQLVVKLLNLTGVQVFTRRS